MPSIAFSFNPATHQYRMDNGKVVPSTTQVMKLAGIGNMDHVAQEVLDRKSAIGSAVHKTCELFDLGEPIEIREPYAMAYLSFRKDSGFTPSLIEEAMVVCVVGMHYGMTIDRLGTLNGEEVLLDLKCSHTIGRHVGVQLAGYDMGLKANNYEGERKRLALQLKPDGSYKLYDFTKYAAQDDAAFLSALRLAYWKEANGVR